MYETLPTGTANRTMTVADLNIPDEPIGVDPLRAAPRHISVTVSATPPAVRANAVIATQSFSLTILVPPAVAESASVPRLDRALDRSAVSRDKVENGPAVTSSAWDVGVYSGTAEGSVSFDVTDCLPGLELPPGFLDRLFELDSIFPQSEEPQNLADQLEARVANARSLGQGGNETEMLDRLAEDGTAWVDAYSPGQVAILRWADSQVEREEVGNTPEAQAALAVLAVALAGGYGPAHRRKAELRPGRQRC
jgi:hypothetical protein